MSDPVCVVEHHGPHGKPRVYALREPGRLWYFDLCVPHSVVGDHWGPAIPFDEFKRQIEQADESAMLLSENACDFGMFRNDFCSRLAWKLASVEGRKPTTMYHRPLTYDDKHVLVPNPNWPPPFVVEEDFHYQFINTGAELVIHSESPKELCDVLNLDPWSSHWHINPFGADSTRYIGYELEDERWYLTYDCEIMPAVIQEISDQMAADLVLHDEKLVDHRPHLEKWLRERGI